jgi:hypothetical protein
VDNVHHSAHWRLAVRAYRVMGTDLVVVVAGFITFVWSRVVGTAILAIGIGIYFVGAVFVFVEVHRVYNDVLPSRPDYAQVHQELLHDALHARSLDAKTDA